MTASPIQAYNINVETYGAGERSLLALHCALGRAAGWKPYAALIGSSVNLTAPDWPGHGRSGKWTEKKLMRDAAHGIVDELIGESAIDLVGHSFGGMIALEFATRHPEKVRTLTLIEPIYLAIAGVDNRALLDEYLEQMQPHFEALEDGRKEDAARLFLDIWGGGANWHDLPEQVQQGMAAQIDVVDACKPGDENDVEEARTLRSLEVLTMPVNLICGAQTLPIVKQVMQGLKARLPHAQLTEIDRASHMLPMTNSADVAESLISFWGENPLSNAMPLSDTSQAWTDA